MINKQRFASWLGLLIVIVHISMVAYLLLVLQPAAERIVAAGEIMLPMTTAYSITIVGWFVANQGIISSDDKIGTLLAVLAVIIVGSFLASLPVGAYLYMQGSMNAEALNKYYTFVESAFGGMFVLIFNFLFEKTPPTE